MKAFKQGKTIFIIKGQQQAKLLSQHHLQRVSTLEKHFKEKKKEWKVRSPIGEIGNAQVIYSAWMSRGEVAKGQGKGFASW